MVGLLNTWFARLPRRVRLTYTKLGVKRFRSGNSQSITEVTPKDNTTNIKEKCCVSVFCACLVSDGGDPSVLQARLSRDWQRGLEITSGRAFAFSSPLTPRPSSWHRHGVTQAFPYILQSFVGVIQKQTPVFEACSEGEQTKQTKSPKAQDSSTFQMLSWYLTWWAQLYWPSKRTYDWVNLDEWRDPFLLQKSSKQKD